MSSEHQDWAEVYNAAMFDHCDLPADVPLTLDFRDRVGTARVERTEQGLHVTARIDADAQQIIDALTEGSLPAVSFAPTIRPDAFELRTETLTLRMRLGRDGRWHPG